MAAYDYDLAIIGGGAAGLTVAAGAAQLGVKTLLLEQEPALGGDCLHFGCVPSKTLISSAKAFHLMRSGETYGLPSCDPGPVDFSQVARRIRDVIATIQVHDSVERFCSLGAKVEFGQAEFADEHSLRIGGTTVSAKRILIATGSSPSAPPIEGLDTVDYLTNKEIFSLEELPASLTVLGGGPIALEMAQSFARLGSKVTVLQRSGQVLSNEDKDMADEVLAALREEGVEVLLNTTVRKVSQENGRSIVDAEVGGEPKSVASDKLLVALGRSPTVGSLKLENAGVEYSSKGVGVDARLRTSQKHIYAAGDVTGAHQFTHAAGYEGGVVVANAVFHLPKKTNYDFLPWCTYTQPELASIGMNEKRAQAAGIEYTVWSESFSGNDRALAESQGQGKIKLLVNKKGKPLGVQIVGPQAGELINEWVAVLGGRVKLSALAGAVHPYPTLGEINKRVAGSIFSGKLFSSKVRKGLKLFFGFKGRACGE
ncbi:MAG: FAD-dependent oxidoreductase [Desulfovibrio sp.]|nr:MAG: FAD-dependent oxidoreductase [Desulfovibrio sp.]